MGSTSGATVRSDNREKGEHFTLVVIRAGIAREPSSRSPGRSTSDQSSLWRRLMGTAINHFDGAGYVSTTAPIGCHLSLVSLDTAQRLTPAGAAWYGKAEVDHWPTGVLALKFHVMPNTSEHWRWRADHARIMTDHMRGPRAKVAMMILAVNYEMLATRAAMQELAEKLDRHKDD